jgi:hypothetical protein
MKLLVTRPDHDTITYCISEWFNKIIKLCDSKGIKYFDLSHTKANKKQVGKVLEKQNPNLVIFNGHGTPDSVMGFKNEVIIKDKKSINWLKEKVVYAIACDSSQKLGEACVKNGTIAYIGYKLPFMILSNPNKSFKPLNDELVKPVMEASNEVVITLLKNNTIEEAYSRSQIKFDQEIKRHQRADAPPEAQNLIPVLLWNKMAQNYHGDSEYSLS